MLKPASLRDTLTAALPQLKKAPDQLSILVKNGTVVCTGAAGLSFEYQYTLELLLFDFSGDADALMLPIVAWVRRHQPDILDNEEKRKKAIRFDAEILGPKTVDLSIEIDLTEAVRVRKQAAPGTGYDVTHLVEPPRIGTVDAPEHWELYDQAGELLLQFDVLPE